MVLSEDKGISGKVIKVGFTGTRYGMDEIQMRSVDAALMALGEVGEFHHGDCKGADAEAATIARNLGWVIIGHPPINTAKRAFFKSDRVLPPDGYLERDKHIVDVTDFLLAAPGEYLEKIRSGTWATIRYAYKKKKRVVMLYPNGATVYGDGRIVLPDERASV